MPTGTVNGATLYYEVEGSGPPVLFVHGSGGNHLSWWQQVPQLSKKHKCVVFDQRSYGASRCTGTGADQEAFVEDIGLLMDRLGIERAHLVGQSLGGNICLGFALANPARVDRLVLAGTLGGVSDPRLDKAMQLPGVVPVDLIERALHPGFRSRSPELTFLYRSIDRTNRIHGSPINFSREAVPPARLAGMNSPTLLVVGVDDPVAPPSAVEVLADMLPNARITVVPDAGHSVYFEQPGLFNRLVSEFLSEER